MKALHAGYVSGALWGAIQANKLSPDLNWQDVIGRLSHFVIDSNVGGDGVLSPELSVLENIICRGLPTLPSLYVEKKIERMTGAIKCGITGKNEVTSYSCKLEIELPTSFIPLLERALCIVSPVANLEPSEGFIFPEFGSGEENTAFDSVAERDFWNGPLTRLLGKGGMQLALRQRSLNSVVGNGFDEQRVDVSVQLPGGLTNGIIIEIDGPSHKVDAAKIHDARRDEACNKSGWSLTYRHCLWRGTSATDAINQKHQGISQIINHPYLRNINQNKIEPLEAQEFGRKAKMLALFPFAVARIQRVILEMIRGGILDIEALSWNIVVLDRDGLTGCGVTAARDLRIWMKKLWALYRPGESVPIIRVYEISLESSKADLPLTVNAFLDISILMRYGVSLPTPTVVSALETTNCRVVIRSDYYDREPDHYLSFGGSIIPQIAGDKLEKNLTFFLQNIFRKVAFRPKQTEIIMRALRGESVIALLPTGAGKSITYQLPTLLQNGMSVVVAPIKSLMKDQDDNLKAIRIDRSAFINSMATAKERRSNTELMQRGCFKYVFVSPERFVIQEFRDALRAIRNEGNVYFAYVVVDEAHCVSEWGHDFRTAYLRLGVNARRECVTRLPVLPILALTGTASFEVLDDVTIELGYTKDDDISVRPDKMERENLKFQVKTLDPVPVIPKGASDKKTKELIGNAKLKQIPEIMSSITNTINGQDFQDFINAPEGAGLVFCPHKSWKFGADEVFNILKETYETAKDRFNVYYGSPEENKSNGFDPIRVQDDFKQGKIKVLACTKAFGMGIDKPDIRFTVHYNIPPSLESFYQEAGRAGRDGEEAQCWIMYTGKMPHDDQSIDYSFNHWFHTNSFPGAEIEEAKVIEILRRNRKPGNSACNEIVSMLAEETGVDYAVNKPWLNQASGEYRIYINHPDFPESKVYLSVSTDDVIKAGKVFNPYPEHDTIKKLIMDWVQSNKPANISHVEWLSQKGAVIDSSGIEELLASGENSTICLSFENGEIQRIAAHLKMSELDVYKAYRDADDADDFVSKLNPPEADRKGLKSVFLKIRLPEHTFRAIYRLTILGAVDDYTIDYAGKTITADLTPLPPGVYKENLLKYIQRHAPMAIGNYRDIVNQCGYETELRCCLHALIQFVYDKIAKQRITALEIMEQTTKRGISDSTAFAQAVTYFFDSSYLPVLRPYLNEYSSDLVFEICEDTAAGSAKLAHLLGACNRLLPENPDNAAFHALRAYALALLGYTGQEVMKEVQAALEGFVKFFSWGRKEKLSFLMELRELIASVNIDSAKAFDAVIIADHTSWLHKFNTDVGTPLSDF